MVQVADKFAIHKGFTKDTNKIQRQALQDLLTFLHDVKQSAEQQIQASRRPEKWRQSGACGETFERVSPQQR